MAKHSAKSPLLTLLLERDGQTPLQVQLFDQVREAILTGRLAPGTGLPATRTLAGELSVSRNTILGAFERLMAEGYIEGQTGSGTRVSKILPEDLLSIRNPDQSANRASTPSGKLSKLSGEFRGGRYARRYPGKGLRAFRPGLPDLEHFPFQLWSRMVAKFWRQPNSDLLLSGDLGGYLPLRRSLAQYLGAVRGLRCHPEQIMITSGAQQALDLISRAIVDPGDDVWVENPGYAGLRSSLKAAGARINHIPVDEEGLSVTAGRRKANNAVLAAVTPSHQYPLGVTMSLGRRLELLDWAAEAKAWLLEDDYDSEFRYRGKPLSALQGLDEYGRVIYVGTFSKVLFPALRLGYLVLPEPLVQPFSEMRAAIDDHPALAMQPALHAFIEEGYFASHIRRLRGLYAERQEILLAAMTRYSEGLFMAKPHEAGMHLVAELNTKVENSDRAITDLATKVDLIVPALSDYFVGRAKSQGLLFGYAGLTEREIDLGMQKLMAQLTAND